jgi:hypothetical protein
VAPHGAAITVSHSEHSMRFSFVSLVLHAWGLLHFPALYLQLRPTRVLELCPLYH